MQRRRFIQLASTAACGALFNTPVARALPFAKSADPTQCRYAPPGEYVKDHTFVQRDGWVHMYSISGSAGLAWLYSGNEETLSWSISRDLVSWDFRGHVVHASERANTFDEDMIWAPFCLEHDHRYYMYYAACICPERPLQYDRRGSFGKFGKASGGSCSIGLATSDDLTRWTKVSDPAKGLDVPGRDPNVVRDEANGRWLMYTTGAHVEGMYGAYVSESQDLMNWKVIKTCAKFPHVPRSSVRGYTLDCLTEFGADTSESLTVLQHPLTKQWIMLANWHYVVSDDPTDFMKSEARLYDANFHGKTMDIGFAGEILQWQGKWYRSGVIGPVDNWKLGLTEIEWVRDGAFRIVTPSVLSGAWGDHKAGMCSDTAGS